MKTLIMVCLIAIATAAFAQEKVLKEMDAVKLSKSSVPATIIQQAEKDFPNVSPFEFYSIGENSVSKDWEISEEVDIETGDKPDHYVVEMKGKGAYYHALYDANGKLLMAREWQKDVALPASVTQAIAKAYPGVPLKKDEHSKVINKGNSREYYVVTLASGKKVTYLPDGTLAKK